MILLLLLLLLFMFISQDKVDIFHMDMPYSMIRKIVLSTTDNGMLLITLCYLTD